MKKFLSFVALISLAVLGGCNFTNGVGLIGHGIGLHSTGYSAFYNCGSARTGSAATEYHGLETRIVNPTNVPARVSGGLLGVVEIPPGGWVRDCVVTSGRSQAVQYTAISTLPDQHGRYGNDSWSARTGSEYGNIDRWTWVIRF